MYMYVIYFVHVTYLEMSYNKKPTCVSRKVLPH